MQAQSSAGRTDMPRRTLRATMDSFRLFSTSPSGSSLWESRQGLTRYLPTSFLSVVRNAFMISTSAHPIMAGEGGVQALSNPIPP